MLLFPALGRFAPIGLQPGFFRERSERVVDELVRWRNRHAGPCAVARHQGTLIELARALGTISIFPRRSLVLDLSCGWSLLLENSNGSICETIGGLCGVSGLEGIAVRSIPSGPTCYGVQTLEWRRGRTELRMLECHEDSTWTFHESGECVLEGEQPERYSVRPVKSRFGVEDIARILQKQWGIQLPQDSPERLDGYIVSCEYAGWKPPPEITVAAWQEKHGWNRLLARLGE